MSKKKAESKPKKEKKEKLSFLPLFWISGNYYDARKKWEEVKSLYKSEVNLQDLECGYSSEKTPLSTAPAMMSDVVMLLKNVDLFDSNPRLIRLYGCPPDFTLLADYLHLIDDQNVVVLYGPIGYNVPTGGGYTRFVTQKTTSLYKQMVEWGTVFEFPLDAESDTEALDWIKKTSTELERPLNHDAAELLVEYKGRNLDNLFVEISKLIACVDGKVITIDDVKAHCIPGFTKTVWEFIDSLDYQNYEKAIEHLELFYAYAEAQPEVDFNRDVEGLLGALEQHFTFLDLVSTACAKAGRITFDNVINAVKGIKKRGEKLSDKKYAYDKDAFEYPYIRRKFNDDAFQSALRRPAERWHEILLDLYRCQRVCRIMRDEVIIKQSLDALVLLACGKISLAGSAKIRAKI